MKILFVDCETLGLPLKYNASYEDVDNWPRLMSLAWMLCSENSMIIDYQHNLIKPEGWEVPKENSGLTMAILPKGA